MNLTEQIATQTDVLVHRIREHCQAVQAENQYASKVKSDVTARYAAQKAQVRQQAESEIQGYERALQEVLRKINADKQIISSFERELKQVVPEIHPNMVAATRKGQFTTADVEDLCDLINKIKETGFIAWIKKRFSLDGYRSNAAMALVLYEKIYSAYDYFKNAAAAEEKKYKTKIYHCEQAAQRRCADLDAQHQQDAQIQSKTHTAKISVLTQQERKITADRRVVQIQKLLADAAVDLGAKMDGWQKYVPARVLPDEILLGLILWPCKIEKPTQMESSLLKKLPSYSSVVNGFTVPLTVAANQPILLYAECEAGDVKLAADVYQTIIARMIRFMPPKAFQAVFFDPVNRGTSLGQLIHFSGEGSCQVCAYYLSSQEINMQMEQLTRHVDEVCKKLTAAGCADIYAYNRVSKDSRIPYTAVVIHDFPNGLDSTSLANLQVLINKSMQCGISIMLSHKRGDKVEHQALEVLHTIQQSFHRIVITEQAKATITVGNAVYSYRPSPLTMTQDYLNGINRLFTYRAPIENHFGKFVGRQQPAIRSAVKGLDIPFAVDEKGQLLDLKIGYDLSAYGFLSGGVGSGKSTLLHMLITSSAMHYHPSDLEIWLIDYKVSEFSFYIKNSPPHVRYVVADQSNEITYSILDEIDAENKRRYRLFSSVGVKDYVGYCESPYGKTHRLPRLLVIIDEFHRMAQAAQAETEYKTILENIFSEARAAGVVLLLSDQQISNGLSGLSQKSRDLISVRIALRNKPDEIREVLAVDNALITDKVKKMILDISAGVSGSMIYKFEIADPDNPLSNKVVFKSGRVIYAQPAERIAVIGNLVSKYAGFKREKTIYVGATRQGMDTRKLEEYEKQYPQNPNAGERFYIGTPMGVQPCFYFNLKHGESGENILLVGNNHEQRISILKAVLSCAKRYGYQVKLLVSKASQLYRQNKAFFNSLTIAQVITAFPDICKYIGERANKLKDMYTDDDLDMDHTATEKELVIFIGLDEIYAQMEASPYNQRTAWTVQTPTPDPAPDGPVDVQKKAGHTQQTPPRTRSVVQEPQQKADPDMDKLMDSLSDIESMLAGLGGRGNANASQTASIPEKYAGPGVTGIKGYNAVKDLSRLISDGWKLGLNSMVVVDRGTAFSKMREVKLDGNFNHRIALVMAVAEAQHFMTRARAMKTLIETNDSISAVYEYLGGQEKCFRPYTFDR